MPSRKIKITIWYNNLNTDIVTNQYNLNADIVTNEHTTTLIIEDCYLLDFLRYLIREDIKKAVVEEYDR